MKVHSWVELICGAIFAVASFDVQSTALKLICPLTAGVLTGYAMYDLFLSKWLVRRFPIKPLTILIALVLSALSINAQSQPKRFQCTVETQPIKLNNCNYEDEEDMIEGGFDLSVHPKWKPALSLAMHGEGTAHFEETTKQICLRQVRPLDGFVRHPANEDLNLCGRKGKTWKR